jgi:hypothetical protein
MTRVTDLERTLRRIGPASGRDLARLLDISPATLSRTVRAAGPHVCRMGRTRGAMYALRRPIHGLPYRIPVMRVERDGTITGAGELSPLEHGAHWFEEPGGRGVLYEGTPPFVADMQPEGYLGAAFARWHSDLALPSRLQDWNDDHRLIALALRGEDALGNLVLGDESLQRLWDQRQTGIEPAADNDYPALARQVADHPVGSSVGGEAPKFLAFSETRGAHVLVKFTSGSGDEADQRWRDLLVAEAIALETLADHDCDVPPARVFDRSGRRFLEVERYDRCGVHGRIGVLSMAALDAEYVGFGSGWSRVAVELAGQRLIVEEDVSRIRWLDAFGELIGNTDRHLGNISFYAEMPAMPTAGQSLAPAYDMLPMTFAPAEGRTRPAAFRPRPPGADEFEVWFSAARAACDYWERVAVSERVSPGFREIATHAGEALEQLKATVRPQAGS